MRAVEAEALVEAHREERVDADAEVRRRVDGLEAVDDVEEGGDGVRSEGLQRRRERGEDFYRASGERGGGGGGGGGGAPAGGSGCQGRRPLRERVATEEGGERRNTKECI